MQGWRINDPYNKLYKIKKGNYFEFKVRLTQNGKPFWAMTPEELVREKPPANP